MPRRTTVYMPDELAAELDKYDVNYSQMFTDAARQTLAELKAERRAEVRQQAADLGQATALEFIAQSPVEAQETLAASNGMLPVPATLSQTLQDLTGGDLHLKTEFYSGWNAGTVSAWQQVQTSTSQAGAAAAMRYEQQRVAQIAADYSDRLAQDGINTVKRLQAEAEDEAEAKQRRASGKPKPSGAGA